MELNVQIYSLFFSFIFGCILNVLLDFFNRFNNKQKLFIKIIFSFLFVLILSLSYFIILIYINNGYLHVYFLISIMVGYIFIYYIKALLFTHLKRK